MRRSQLISVVAVFLIFIASIAAVRSGDIYFQIKKQLTIFSDIYKEVATLHVDEHSPEALMKKGIDAMLDSLDPYTSFVDEGQQQEMEILSTGTYGGIGVDVGYRGERIVVIAPFEGYPAERAGIRPGDIIQSINGLSTEGMNPEEVQRLSIGDIGSSVHLEIERRGIDQILEFELERERIEVKNITYSGLIGDGSDIGYVQLTRFGQNTSEELRLHLAEFKEQENLRGLILDFRNNPGGLLDEAVYVVDKFIEPGEMIVETRGRVQEQSRTFRSEEPALFDELPLVVLLNNGSASASEVVAGALQDLDRAVIIGESSFGKGLVQTIRPLSYNTSLRLTVSRYYTPSGRSIQSSGYGSEGDGSSSSSRTEYQTRNGRAVYDGVGIKPDVEISSVELTHAETAIRQQNQYIFFINDYLAELGDPEGEIPGDLYDAFIAYLEDENFDYETQADKQIGNLKSNMDQFEDSGKAAELLDELDELAHIQKKNNLHNSREGIEKSLKLEWISRTQGESEKMKLSIPMDEMINESLIVLRDPERYNRILSN